MTTLTTSSAISSIVKNSVNQAKETRLAELGFTAQSLREAVTAHSSSREDETPSVWVTTWEKYNEGGLNGMWVNLASFGSYSEFIIFLKAVNADEEFPEFAFLDSEFLPNSLVSEYGISEDAFEKIMDFCEIRNQYGADALSDWFENYDEIYDFEEAYCGQHGSEEDFVRGLIDEEALYNKLGDLALYFDFEAYARDLFINDYFMGANGYVFRRC